MRPYHPYDQADLLGLAAMLQRAPVKVPGSSLTQGLSVNSHVTVSLKAGEAIPAHWPFSDMPSEPLPGVIRQPGDSREKLAALLTDPRSDRFPAGAGKPPLEAALRIRNRGPRG